MSGDDGADERVPGGNEPAAALEESWADCVRCWHSTLDAEPHKKFLFQSRIENPLLWCPRLPAAKLRYLTSAHPESGRDTIEA